MKIAIIGGFRPDYWVGLECSYARAFRALGHHVSEISEATVSAPRLPRGLNQLEELVTARAAESRLARDVEASGAELVVIIKGRTISASCVARLRSAGRRVVNVFPDNPFEGAASGLVATGLLAQFRAVDRVFVHDRFAVGQLRACRVQSDFLAFAHDPAVHAAAPPELRVGGQPRIVFLGNPDRERIRYLRAIADLGLEIYGAWEWARLAPNDPLSRCVRGPVQLGPDFVHLMRSSLFSVNVLRHSQKTAHNMRTFETPACGACSISERSVGVEEFMRNEREIFTFGSPSELRAIAQRVIADPGRAHDVAAAGYAHVRGHTYTARAREVLHALDL